MLQNQRRSRRKHYLIFFFLRGCLISEFFKIRRKLVTSLPPSSDYFVLKAHSSVLSVEMGRCSFSCLSPLGLNFRGIFRKTALKNTLSSFHTGPESSVTFPRSLGSPRISLRNAQRRKNCSLSWKDAALEERKKANSGTKKTGKTGGAGRGAERKKKKTNAEKHWAELNSVLQRPRPRPSATPRGPVSPLRPDPSAPRRASRPEPGGSSATYASISRPRDLGREGRRRKLQARSSEVRGPAISLRSPRVGPHRCPQPLPRRVHFGASH